MEGIHVVKAVPDSSGKVYFRDDVEGCPQSAACLGKAYVVAGDEMLVSAPVEGWVCAWYFSKKHEYVGWIRSSEAVAVETRQPRPQDWVGAWGDSADLSIETGAKGSLHVTGSAIWTGLGEGNVHTGELDDSAVPLGNRLEIGDPNEEYACHVVFTLLNDYLVADDSGNCGGMNVSFSGVYRRAAKRAK